MTSTLPILASPSLHVSILLSDTFAFCKSHMLWDILCEHSPSLFIRVLLSNLERDYSDQRGGMSKSGQTTCVYLVSCNTALAMHTRNCFLLLLSVISGTTAIAIALLCHVI